ncbi:MAG: DUF2911 domain-containing protein [Bernardetiaceae bacterium]
MKIWCSLLFLVWGMASTATAQELPRISPRASLIQDVGLTQVRIDYSRPALRGRKGKVWGRLIPYDELWRAGANEATILSVSESVSLNEKELPAGKYAFFVIPHTRSPWEVVLSTDTASWGVDGFKKENIVLQFFAEVNKVKGKSIEHLAFIVNEISETTATLSLIWEKKCLSFRLHTDTQAQAIRNIEAAIAAAPDNWRVYARSVEFYVKHLTNTDIKARKKATDWIDKALKINQEHYLLPWLKAELLAQSGDYTGAISYAQKALRLGESEQGANFIYQKTLEELIKQWQRP